jgi:sugar phosphate isomerase/epimerase
MSSSIVVAPQALAAPIPSCFLAPTALARDGRIEIRLADQVADRTWNYVTLGRGDDEPRWRGFCRALAAIGYHDVPAIEREDLELPPLEGITQSVALLRRVIAAG